MATPVFAELGEQMQRWWWRAASALQRRLGPSLAALHRHMWAILAILAAVATVLGTWDFYQRPNPAGDPATFWDALYYALQLFVLQSGAPEGPVGWQLNIARFLAALVAAGALFRALVMLFYDQFEVGLLRLFGHNHVIVCGLGRKGAALVTELRERDEWVVVVENDPENPALQHCRELGATVLIGSATNPRVLGNAGVSRAKALVSVMGSDGANVETAVVARQLNATRKIGALRCVIHVVDRGLNEMLRQTEMANREDDPFDLVFFNAYETCARVMLRDSGWNLACTSVTGSPHLLLAGLGELGETLAVEAAREWKDGGSGRMFNMTVIDRRAETKQPLFQLQHPQVAEVCHLRFCQLDVRQPQFAGGAFLQDLDGGSELTAAYVCLGDDALGMYAGLALVEMLKPRRVPIVVRMSERAGLATALRAQQSDPGFVDGLQAVGLVELTCTAELVLGTAGSATSGAAVG
jgi:hypothetical protein